MKTSLIAGLLACTAGSAFAQTFDGPPAYGDVNWSPGDRPTGVVVLASGAMPAHWLENSCRGYISPAPSARLILGEAGDVSIAAGSDEDLTLAVRGPDGVVTCDDDGADGANPGITLSDAPAGTYEIWVGTYSPGVGHPTTVLHVGDSFNTENPFVVRPDPTLRAAQSARLTAGFADDPRRFNVRAGGEAAMESLGDGCFGFTGAAPNLALDYQAGDYELYFLMEADADGVIAVRTPSGEMLCNDDQLGLNPGVNLENPDSGRYQVWVGLLSESRRIVDGVLSISEIGFAGMDTRLNLAAPAQFGTQTLTSGFTPDPVVMSSGAGGPIDVSIAAADGVIATGYCTGYVASAPSVELTYEAGALPLYIAARGEADLTLAVNGPDGAWHCDDDSGGDLNPEIAFTEPQSGVYDIYVGTFSEYAGDAASAELFISEIEGLPSGPQVDLTLPALFGDYSLSAGFLPDPFEIELQAGGPLSADDAGAGGDMVYCAGNITQAPSVELNWSGEGGPLYIFALSEEDNTLAVNLPDGSWICDDDGGEGFNAAISLETAPSGVYDIYVGLFSGTATWPATLNISEIEAPGDSWGEGAPMLQIPAPQ